MKRVQIIQDGESVDYVSRKLVVVLPDDADIATLARSKEFDKLIEGLADDADIDWSFDDSPSGSIDSTGTSEAFADAVDSTLPEVTVNAEMLNKVNVRSDADRAEVRF